MKKKEKEKEYEFSAPWLYKDVDADAVGAELKKIEDAGDLTAEAVVDAARDPKSTMHDCFEWDNTKAAEKYRLDQARRLIRGIRVIDKSSKPPNRVYVSVESTDDRKRHYERITAVSQTDADLIMIRALRDLRAWADRYAELQTRMPTMFKAVNSILGMLKGATEQHDDQPTLDA